MVGIQDQLTGPQVVSSDVMDTPRGPWARVVTLDPADAGPRLAAFPLEALEWRAAEYGVDPHDVDALLDIVLHEPYLAEEPVAYTAPTVHAARAVHLGRIADLKASGRRVSTLAGADGVDPLQPVRDAYAVLLDVEQVAAKARYVERHRVAVRARAERRAAVPGGWVRRPISGISDQVDAEKGTR